jgi:hypothetical protein
MLTTTVTVTSLSSTTGYNQIQVDDTNGLTFYSGSAGQNPRFQVPQAGGLVTLDGNTAVASANTATTIDSFVNATYRTAKYIIQATNGANYQSSEALVIQNGTTATISVYGTVQTGGNLGVTTATVSGGNTLVQFVAANASTNVRIFREYVPV